MRGRFRWGRHIWEDIKRSHISLCHLVSCGRTCARKYASKAVGEKLDDLLK
jgi:hypothetical protein